MKSTLARLLIAAWPALAFAQAEPVPKPAAAPAAKATKPGKPGAKPATTRTQAGKPSEEAGPMDEPDPSIQLTAADFDIARTVYVGEIPCELDQVVMVRPLRHEGFFLVQVKHTRFVMHPVASRTGAVRLEDPARGALWLQLGNKSMLMSQKLGQRLADECQSPEQKAYAEVLKKNPIDILEPAPPASGAAPAANPPLKSGPN